MNPKFNAIQMESDSVNSNGMVPWALGVSALELNCLHTRADIPSGVQKYPELLNRVNYYVCRLFLEIIVG